MKNILKKVVSMLMIFTGAFSFGSIFSGCSAKKHLPENINSVSCSCSHMNAAECFSFSLSESDGELKFDAWCFMDKNGVDLREISLENVTVDSKYLDNLRGVIIDNSIIESINSYSKPLVNIFVADQTKSKIGLGFYDGSYLSAEISNEALKEFFYNMASEIDQNGTKPTSADAPVSNDLVSLSYSCTDMTYEGCFSFEIQKQNDKTLLSSNFCYLDDSTKFKEISFSGKEISGEHFTELIKLIDEYNFINYLQNYEKTGDDLFALDAPSYNLYANFGSSFRYSVSDAVSFSDILLDFFKKLSINTASLN